MTSEAQKRAIARWKANHPEQWAESHRNSMKKYYLKNRERILERMKAYYYRKKYIPTVSFD